MTNTQDPMLRDLIQLAKSPVTRRTVLAGAGVAAGALTLAACSPGGAKRLSPAEDLSADEHVVTWDNWPYYMDGESDSSFPSIKAFEQQTGIKVHYNINIDDNNTYYARIKNQLGQGKDTGADTFCLTDWMAARLINSGLVQELNYKNLPQVTKNLDPYFKGSAWSYDPDRAHSLPWKGITAGIGYHKENYKKLTGKDAPQTVADLWAPELKGKVVVLSEMRDSVGLVLMSQGIDITSADSLTEDAFMAAIEFVKQQIDGGQIYNVRGNSYLDDLATGNIIAATAWSGDITVINAEQGTEDNPEPYGFIFPDSGVTLWADWFVTPMGATHKKNVEKLINYYYDPVNAAELALWVNYITPVVGAQDVAASIDPALAENQLIFPNADTLAKSKAFRALSGQEEQRFSSAWQNLLLGA